jgi:hypothetical protein
MRNGQNKRMRGRGNNNNRKSSNPLTRVYESNGPDVKIRGTASHVAEKYIQLARDAQGSGDPVSAENYYQHAEHYFRLIAAAQEQFRQGQQQPFMRPEGGGGEQRDEMFDDDGDDFHQNEPGYREPQAPRDNQYQNQPREQHHQNRDQQQPYPRDHQQPRVQQQGVGDGQGGADTSGLPSFITGQQGQGQNYQNGHEGQADRYPLHRRRRRHRGPRNDMPSQGGGDQRPTND